MLEWEPPTDPGAQTFWDPSTNRPMSCCCEFHMNGPVSCSHLLSGTLQPLTQAHPPLSAYLVLLAVPSYSSKCHPGLFLQPSVMPPNPFGVAPASHLSISLSSAWAYFLDFLSPWELSSPSMPRHTWLLQLSPPAHMPWMTQHSCTASSYQQEAPMQHQSLLTLHTGASLHLVHLGPFTEHEPLAPPPCPSTHINKGPKLQPSLQAAPSP